MSTPKAACGACAGTEVQTPAPKFNPPGQPALRYRVGTQPQFLASLLARLSGADFPALAALTARTADDPTIALCDATATVGEVLSFYQERLVNEASLRTATERRSLLELASLVGYQPAPGVAASTHLAFEMDTPFAPEAPPVLPVELPVGSRVQSVPGPGEKPQTFETVEAITARPEFNAIRPRLSAAPSLSAGLNDLYLQGTATQLNVGDALLLLGAASTPWELAVVSTVDVDAPNGRTRVSLSQPLAQAWSGAGGEQVFALRQRAALFGHNAPRILDANGVLKADPVTPEALPAATTRIDLDNAYPKLLRDSWLLLQAPQVNAPDTLDTELYRVGTVSQVSVANYGISGRVTRLSLSGQHIEKFGIRRTLVLAQSDRLALAERPLASAVQSGPLLLEGHYPALRPGQALAFSGVDPQGVAVAEIAHIAEGSDAVTHAGGRTTITLGAALQHAYQRASLRINANVARATHGETMSEIAGSGRAAQADQRFTLRQFPLTYVEAARPEGCEATLEVRINDLLWHEVPSLYQQPGAARVYRLARDDEGRTQVQFGDGVEGARLPTGQDNVRLRYRKGLGAAGNLRAGALSTLLTRPLGLKAVLNPPDAAGGADAETRESIRDNAPVSVLTLGRAVSVRDYADFARSFAGIAKSHALWIPYGSARGMHLTVAGPEGAAIAADSQKMRDLVQALRAAGDPLIPLTVQSFQLARFELKAKLRIAPDFLAAKVLAAARAAVQTRFSFAVRDFGQPLALSEVVACLQGVAGVVAVDVDQLRRSDQPPTPQPPSRLPAFLPQPDASGNVAAAELLLASDAAPELQVMP